MMLTRLGYYNFAAIMVLFILVACNRTPGNQPAENGNLVSTPSSEEHAKATGPVEEEQMRQAALEGNLEQVKDLVKRGINVNAPDQEGHTALMFAAFNGHTAIVLELIEAGAIVDRRDLLGRTALLYGSTGPFPETVSALLDKGADPNIVDSNEHFTPLMHAAAEGNLDVVKILVDHGADLSMTDVDNDNAESFARQAGHLQVAAYLREIR